MIVFLFFVFTSCARVNCVLCCILHKFLCALCPSLMCMVIRRDSVQLYMLYIVVRACVTVTFCDPQLSRELERVAGDPDLGSRAAGKLRHWITLIRKSTFTESLKSITLPGAAPGHRKLGGAIREASHMGEYHTESADPW